MKKYLFSSKGWFFAYFTTLILNQALIISVALYLKYVVDAAAELDHQKLILSIYYGVAFVFALFLIEFLRRMCRAKYIRKSVYTLKQDLFSGLMKKNIKDFSQSNSAGYISILNNNVKTIEDQYISNFFSIVQDALKLIIALSMMFYLSPIVAVAAVLFSFVPLLIPTLFGKKLALLQSKYMKSLETFNQKIKDFLTGFEVIKTFKIEQNVQNHFDEINMYAENEKYRVNRANAFVNALGNMFSVATQFAIFLVAGFFVLQGQLTVGAIVAVTQLSGNVVAPLMSLIQERNLLKSVKLVNDKAYEIIKTESTDDQGQEIDQFEDKIELKNVSFSYDGKVKTLENINYTFEKGKKYAIVGASGSGKSTLLKLILRYFDQYQGEIRIDHIESRSINMNSLYKICSIIHQNVFIFDDTIRNNITLYNPYSDAIVAKAVEKSGLASVVSSLEKGLSTYIGEGGGNLSGGQRQRIAIARALVKGSDILFLDEAMANLDNETAYHIEKSLLEIPELTCLIVTHRYHHDLLKKYDRILVLKDGRLCEEGTFDDLIEKKGYFYSLYNVAQ